MAWHVAVFNKVHSTDQVKQQAACAVQAQCWDWAESLKIRTSVSGWAGGAADNIFGHTATFSSLKGALYTKLYC